MYLYKAVFFQVSQVTSYNFYYLGLLAIQLLTVNFEKLSLATEVSGFFETNVAEGEREAWPL